jgi:hypothetical protein
MCQLIPAIIVAGIQNLGLGIPDELTVEQAQVIAESANKKGFALTKDDILRMFYILRKKPGYLQEILKDDPSVAEKFKLQKARTLDGPYADEEPKPELDCKSRQVDAQVAKDMILQLLLEEFNGVPERLYHAEIQIVVDKLTRVGLYYLPSTVDTYCGHIRQDFRKQGLPLIHPV